MGDMSPHFDRKEFVCKCGCGKSDVSQELVNMLEKMYAYFAATPTGCKCIIVNSGCRCSKHSVAVGGYTNDAHTRGIAADITVYRSDGVAYIPEVMAAVAEYVGFSGIGLMASNVHVDIRNRNNYTNAHWFGDEVTGDNNIQTFKQFLPQQTQTNSKHKVQLIIDGKTVYTMEV